LSKNRQTINPDDISNQIGSSCNIGVGN